MNPKKTLGFAVVAVLLVAVGVWLSMHRAGQQADLGGRDVFPDLEAALGDITEIRLAKGDGSRVTLRRHGAAGAATWTVVERDFPADPVRVRDLALALARLRVVEAKTSDPANYSKLGVEATDSPAATGTLVEVQAGTKTWALIVGKGAEGRAAYVRKPAEAGSLLVAPLLTVDPDQKRWIDRLLVDLPGTGVHDIAVRAGQGPAYVLSRAARGATDLALTPVPRGRAAANAMALGSQAEALASFHFDDLRPLPAPAPAYPDTATYRTFDGQVIEFSGRREADKAYVIVKAHRDAALAARFAPPPAPAPAPAATPAATPTATPAATPESQPATPEPGAQTVERLATRVNGVEFEIPLYKYDAIFRAHDELLEPKP